MDRFNRHITGVLILISMVSSLHGQTFDILGERDKATFPFEYRNNFIVIDVELDHTLPMHFIFDTGAEHTVLLKNTYAELLGLKYDGTINIIGSDLRKNLKARISRSVSLSIPPLRTVKTDLLVLNRDYLYLDKLTGRSIDGILGANFFHDHIVRINYDKQELTLYKPDAFRVPQKHFYEFPIDVRRGKPYLTVGLNPQKGHGFPVELLIDTGAGLSLLLHSNTDPELELPDSTILGQVGAGLGGYLSGYLGTIYLLTLDKDLEFNNLVVPFQELDSTLASSRKYMRNGLLGNVLLSRFEVILDYPHRRIFLNPDRSYNRSIKYDRSGLILFAAGEELNRYVIRGVIEGSPAAKAGIRPGDVIKRFQWFPASWYSLEGILKRLKKRGDKKIRLVLVRNGKKVKKSFRLRDIF